jgi:hypothetical protein
VPTLASGSVTGPAAVDADALAGLLGLRLEQAVAAGVRSLERSPRWPHGERRLYGAVHQVPVAIDMDDDAAVEAVEAFDEGVVGSGAVVVRGVDVFGTPAEEVLQRLRSRGLVFQVGEAGHLAVADAAYLSLWRSWDSGRNVAVEPDDDEDALPPFFASVLFARPGYGSR